MYAVIKTGGKQYRVQPGDVLVVEKLDAEVGAEVAFDQVEGAVVTGTLVETRKGDKIKVFKKIRRQGYKRTKGHRQLETVVRITSLTGAGETAKWDGEVDMTPRLVLRARARGLAPVVAAEGDAA
jgi:large subunit ribosomal protein L21